MFGTLILITTWWLVWFANAQIIFWKEDFENCSSNTLPSTCTTGQWTEQLLSAPPGNGYNANRWYISCDECGPPPSQCGDFCGGFFSCAALNDKTLHVTAPPSYWGIVCTGACYYDGTIGFFSCLPDGSNTHKRVISPLIDATGKSGLSIRFNYIMNGEPGDDKATVYYSVDGGTTWNLLTTLSPTPVCLSGQGQWTSSGWIPLPPSADNNPNLRISIVWQNDGDCIASDPSFAIDDIEIAYSTPAPLDLIKISGNWIAADRPKIMIEVRTDISMPNSRCVLEWNTGDPTQSEVIFNSECDLLPDKPLKVIHSTPSVNSVNTYIMTVRITSGETLKSNLLRMSPEALTKRSLKAYYDYRSKTVVVNLPDWLNSPQTYHVKLLNAYGKVLVSRQIFIESSAQYISIYTGELPPGIYSVTLQSSHSSYIALFARFTVAGNP